MSAAASPDRPDAEAAFRILEARVAFRTLEARVASRILGVIETVPTAMDQAVRIFEIYRDYARSEAAQAAATGPSGEEILQLVPYTVEAAVASALVDLARHNRVTDETREPLLRIAGLGARTMSEAGPESTQAIRRLVNGGYSRPDTPVTEQLGLWPGDPDNDPPA